MSKGEGGREERKGRAWAGHAGPEGQWGRLGFDPKGGGSPEGLCAQKGEPDPGGHCREDRLGGQAGEWWYQGKGHCAGPGR